MNTQAEYQWVADHLDRTLELLSDPKRWTQRAMARDASGETCSSLASEATCWCQLGARRRMAPNWTYAQFELTETIESRAWFLEHSLLAEAALAVSRKAGWPASRNPIELNDRATHNDVIQMLTAARDKARTLSNHSAVSP